MRAPATSSLLWLLVSVFWILAILTGPSDVLLFCDYGGLGTGGQLVRTRGTELTWHWVLMAHLRIVANIKREQETVVSFP